MEEIRPLRVMVPLDEFSGSEEILETVETMARSLPARVTLLHVAAHEARADEARARLETIRAALEARRVSTDVLLSSGEAAPGIVKMAAARRYDLIAMVTRARGGMSRSILGSVAEEVLASAHCPVLLQRAGGDLFPWERLLVALDGTSETEGIVEDAVSLARRCKAAIHLLGVWRPHSPFARDAADPIVHLRRISDRLHFDGLKVMPVVREGPPARAIVQYAREIESGLICMMTHARSGLARIAEGSVAGDVVRHAPCPILIRRIGTGVPHEVAAEKSA